MMVTFFFVAYLLCPEIFIQIKNFKRPKLPRRLVRLRTTGSGTFIYLFGMEGLKSYNDFY